MAEKRKNIPPLDPSLTEFDAYYKADNGRWYQRGQITEDDRDPEVQESVVAEAVHKSKRSRTRQVMSKLRKRAFVEAKQFAAEVARHERPKCPLAFDIKVVAS